MSSIHTIFRRARSTPRVSSRPRTISVQSTFHVGRAIGTTLIGIMGTLACTGIIATISISIKVATLSDDVARTEAVLQRNLDHTVDKDEYLRRDAQIQRAIDGMATKEELRGLKTDLTDALSTLHEIQATLADRQSRR